MAFDFQDQDLAGFNTLGLPARAMVHVLQDESRVPALCNALREQPAPALFVLGAASNVVMHERPRHRVLRVALRGIRLCDETRDTYVVEVAAGESWHEFVRHCLQSGWPGLENLALIPGTVGAAPVQNIGAYGLELRERIHSVVAWDLLAGRLHEFSASDCDFGYRDSRFKRAGAGRWLIVRVRFALPRRWQPRLIYSELQADLESTLGPRRVSDARQVFDAVCRIRRRKLPDPAVMGNAGSFFKNPVVDGERASSLKERYPELPLYPQADGSFKLAAGWMIERAGWKGRRLGPVGMHTNQALVLVNYGSARAQDVLRLARAVRDTVREQFGIALEQEPVDLD